MLLLLFQYQSAMLHTFRYEAFLIFIILDGLKNYPGSILLGIIFFSFY
jgi:hypothetical protein